MDINTNYNNDDFTSFFSNPSNNTSDHDKSKKSDAVVSDSDADNNKKTSKGKKPGHDTVEEFKSKIEKTNEYIKEHESEFNSLKVKSYEDLKSIEFGMAKNSIKGILYIYGSEKPANVTEGYIYYKYKDEDENSLAIFINSSNKICFFNPNVHLLDSKRSIFGKKYLSIKDIASLNGHTKIPQYPFVGKTGSLSDKEKKNIKDKIEYILNIVKSDLSDEEKVNKFNEIYNNNSSNKKSNDSIKNDKSEEHESAEKLYFLIKKNISSGETSKYIYFCASFLKGVNDTFTSDPTISYAGTYKEYYYDEKKKTQRISTNYKSYDVNINASNIKKEGNKCTVTIIFNEYLFTVSFSSNKEDLERINSENSNDGKGIKVLRINESEYDNYKNVPDEEKKDKKLEERNKTKKSKENKEFNYNSVYYNGDDKIFINEIVKDDTFIISLYDINNFDSPAHVDSQDNADIYLKVNFDDGDYTFYYDNTDNIIYNDAKKQSDIEINSSDITSSIDDIFNLTFKNDEEKFLIYKPGSKFSKNDIIIFDENYNRLYGTYSYQTKYFCKKNGIEYKPIDKKRITVGSIFDTYEDNIDHTVLKIEQINGKTILKLSNGERDEKNNRLNEISKDDIKTGSSFNVGIHTYKIKELSSNKLSYLIDDSKDPISISVNDFIKEINFNIYLYNNKAINVEQVDGYFIDKETMKEYGYDEYLNIRVQDTIIIRNSAMDSYTDNRVYDNTADTLDFSESAVINSNTAKHGLVITYAAKLLNSGIKTPYKIILSLRNNESGGSSKHIESARMIKDVIKSNNEDNFKEIETILFDRYHTVSEAVKYAKLIAKYISDSAGNKSIDIIMSIAIDISDGSYDTIMTDSGDAILLPKNISSFDMYGNKTYESSSELEERFKNYNNASINIIETEAKPQMNRYFYKIERTEKYKTDEEYKRKIDDLKESNEKLLNDKIEFYEGLKHDKFSLINKNCFTRMTKNEKIRFFNRSTSQGIVLILGKNTVDDKSPIYLGDYYTSPAFAEGLNNYSGSRGVNINEYPSLELLKRGEVDINMNNYYTDTDMKKRDELDIIAGSFDYKVDAAVNKRLAMDTILELFGDSGIFNNK